MVGVKWNVQAHGGRHKPGAHLGMLVGGVVVEDAWTSLPAGTTVSIRLRKRMNSSPYPC